MSTVKNCQRIDQLIRKKATGTPTQLAKRLSLSPTYVKRLIGYMRHEYKMPIIYTISSGYIYTRKGYFFVGFVDEE
ncbi:hypothetical protein HQN86_00410 [Pedobacter panaciterrae]|uniref:hypothetical protein n=1 Tax=Pedobacter panaciterrae TaxID=363849 RepID=UPI00155D9A4F|nr:hypothetical protein [Pedobacter panaciterrae]NQX52064.1 hypothetical protein [Pedobacter panaciterrae]